ncbi:phosphoenolpyruvate carboxykinase (ATP) [Brevibacillus composti]|uniref:Phosphoenolpyruvate carboxykinase (ATP) n=1 Tax=Brevibacillus composti TaxID=2796470 RepID=A0A7T5EM77_9BACL|nr:phosphoenolpyruvate carboxykinase (ATP) [Brevibacillus composti]QQE75175.1 phosphoenolpyruvate carboxykinase (ATP) [Brevibacillus composti]QUO42263.1 phosphoenolpyruvate carboxykinase (ATP) [Brevibacillus composti]
METKTVHKLADVLANATVHANLPVAKLVEMAVKRGEGIMTDKGALNALTGKFTGRSPKDKFVVDEASVHDKINWGPVNQPISAENFQRLYQDVMDYLQTKELFVFDGFAGADKTYRLPIRVVNEYAWHNLFARQLFIRPSAEELAEHKAEFTVVYAPTFKADPQVHGTNSETFIITSFEQKIVLIGGTEYAGEMKKSIFSVMNLLLPEQNVLSMHCSANVGKDGDVALFFGLSGTGKTTLSADPDRFLIGDDEHGWSDHGVFNIEGGCYAKCIRLSEEGEPQIWSAIQFGTVLENVEVDPDTRQANYDSDKYTENTRAAYPVEAIPGAVIPGVGGQPHVIIFLTADSFGVLPPISKLTKEQAMYHFLSGYTSKMAGTERGVTAPQTEFSTCFGSPFLPLHPVVYAEMLGKKIDERDVQVYLVNTGWTGGPVGVGSRMKLSYTRAMVTASLNGELAKASYVTDPIFGVQVPTSCPNVPSDVLLPRNTWADPDAYDKQARDLASRFIENFQKKFPNATDIAAAGPKVQ